MKYEYPEMQLINLCKTDIVTLSGVEGDGGEFDPLNPASLQEINEPNW